MTSAGTTLARRETTRMRLMDAPVWPVSSATRVSTRRRPRSRIRLVMKFASQASSSNAASISSV